MCTQEKLQVLNWFVYFPQIEDNESEKQTATTFNRKGSHPISVIRFNMLWILDF
jgi:hypothetical protein